MTDDLVRAEIEAMRQKICVGMNCEIGIDGERCGCFSLAEDAHTAASRVREERGFVVVQEKYVNYELADLEARRHAQSSYCPKCGRVKNDWDCAEFYCPMAAASQQRTADNAG